MCLDVLVINEALKPVEQMESSNNIINAKIKARGNFCKRTPVKSNSNSI
jgi:hypothetical protein